MDNVRFAPNGKMSERTKTGVDTAKTIMPSETGYKWFQTAFYKNPAASGKIAPKRLHGGDGGECGGFGTQNAFTQGY